jgi:tetratricopeptide (TPR) repeat protein
MCFSYRKWCSHDGLAMGVFFVLAYVYFLLCVDPLLIYHVQGRLFLWGSAFFDDFSRSPGGLLEYGGLFLTQFFYFPVIGALVPAGILTIVVCLTSKYLCGLGKLQAGLLSFVPGVLLLILHSRYTFPLTVSLGLVVLLGFVALYVRVPIENRVARMAVFLVLSGVAYPVAGGALVWFGVLCGLFEFAKRRRLCGLFCLLAAAAIPYGIGLAYPQATVGQAYGWPWPEKGSLARVLTAALYAFFPVAGAGTVLFLKAMDEKNHAPSNVVARAVRQMAAIPAAHKARWAFRWPIFALIAAAAVYGCFDRTGKFLTQMDRYAQQRMWPELLREVRAHRTDPIFVLRPRNAAGTVLVVHDINRALYHEGRLPYDMFSFPQFVGQPSLLLADEKFCYANSSAFSKRAGLLLDLGRINEAEHMTHEAWADLGDHPSVFRNLVLINVVKGRAAAARNVLAALERSFLYQGWAEKYQRALETDPLLSSNAQAAWLRSATYNVDLTVPTAYGYEEEMLQWLLQTNKHNRMAFEYLMAYYLLNNEPSKIAGNLSLLDYFDYAGIPRHYEEAILLYMSEQGRSSVDLHGRTIRPETVQRFRDFQRRAALAGKDAAALWDALFDTYGNTYWFYHLFGLTGFGREVSVNHPGAYAEAALP